MKNKNWFLLLLAVCFLASCSDDDEAQPTLQVPTTYSSTSFAANVTAENTVMSELSTVTAAISTAEANAQRSTIAAIPYPSTLASVTLPSY